MTPLHPINEEIRQHLKDRYRDLRSRGVPEDEPRALVADELNGIRGGDLAPRTGAIPTGRLQQWRSRAPPASA